MWEWKKNISIPYLFGKHFILFNFFVTQGSVNVKDTTRETIFRCTGGLKDYRSKMNICSPSGRTLGEVTDTMITSYKGGCQNCYHLTESATFSHVLFDKSFHVVSSQDCNIANITASRKFGSIKVTFESSVEGFDKSIILMAAFKLFHTFYKINCFESPSMLLHCLPPGCPQQPTIQILRNEMCLRFRAQCEVCNGYPYIEILNEQCKSIFLVAEMKIDVKQTCFNDYFGVTQFTSNHSRQCVQVFDHAGNSTGRIRTNRYNYLDPCTGNVIMREQRMKATGRDAGVYRSDRYKITDSCDNSLIAFIEPCNHANTVILSFSQYITAERKATIIARTISACWNYYRFADQCIPKILEYPYRKRI